MTRALLLNLDHTPLGVIPARRAVTMYLYGKADVVEYSGEEFHSSSTTVLVPDIMRVKKWVDLPARQRSIALIPKNVCARDEFVCAYCGGHATTMDHVQPKAKGGKHTWENITAACKGCNGIKSDNTLPEMRELYPKQVERWTLIRQPYRPIGVNAHLIRLRPRRSWMPYLQVGESLPNSITGTTVSSHHPSETVSTSAP